MKKSLKEQAIDLRKAGWSYNIIAQKLTVAKSTLSHWLREVPYQPNEITRKRIKEGPAKSAVIRHNQKLSTILSTKLNAAKEIGKLKHRDLWMLGIGLYIGEGMKVYESTRIINSDPKVIELAIKWFRDVCHVPLKHFSIAIHLYPDTPISEAQNFWSKLTRIPLEQFGKTQVDKRLNKSLKKQRKLPYGTAHISVKSCGKPEFGVLLHRQILGWIEEVYNQTRGYSLVVKRLSSKEKSRVRFPLPAPKNQASLF